MEDLFGRGSSDEEDNTSSQTGFKQQFDFQEYLFPEGIKLKIREFSFHPLNANIVWPGTLQFAEWIQQNWKEYFEGKNLLELGSASGALSLFIKKWKNVDVITSDYSDDEIEKNIRHNYQLNGINDVVHLVHTWGEPLSENLPSCDVIFAINILQYSAQYGNLIKSLKLLLHKPTSYCILAWGVKIKKENINLFIELVKEAHFQVKDFGRKIIQIYH